MPIFRLEPARILANLGFSGEGEKPGPRPSAARRPNYPRDPGADPDYPSVLVVGEISY